MKGYLGSMKISGRRSLFFFLLVSCGNNFPLRAGLARAVQVGSLLVRAPVLGLVRPSYPFVRPVSDRPAKLVDRDGNTISSGAGGPFTMRSAGRPRPRP